MKLRDPSWMLVDAGQSIDFVSKDVADSVDGVMESERGALECSLWRK
jgi:hypothetical protein